jgi:hypothetical protein
MDNFFFHIHPHIFSWIHCNAAIFFISPTGWNINADSPAFQNYLEFNLLVPEFFLILAHPVYKMWIIHEPNTLGLWNKLHLQEEKNGEYIPCLKYSVPIFVE